MKAMTFVVLLVFILSACGPAPTPTRTPIPPTATVPPPTASPPLAIGSTQVSPVDGMVQVYVPAGDFLMGATDAEIAQALQMCSECKSDAFNDEKPQHTVFLDAYWIDQTDATNAMFAKCVTAGVCQPPPDTESSNRVSYYGESPYDRYPVIYVSWDDAKAYCGWAGRRLPTEAEWEKAARGTDGRLYPWGNQAPSPTLANYANHVGDTTAVGKYPAGASPYGALDMSGNVWQWVADWHGDNYYASSPDRNPTGPTSGDGHVLRGGAWSFEAAYIRATRRDWGPLQVRDVTGGFRCARSP